ncbi:hypothetical protein [Paracoccus versutus]
MTIRFRFSKSDLITTAGVAIRPLKIDDKGGLFERLGQPGITERHSHEELAALLRRPDTTYVAGYFDRTAQEIRGRKSVDVVNELREAVRRLVIWRKAFCDAFLYLESLGFINRTHEGYLKGRERLAAEIQRRVGEGPASGRAVRPGADIITRQLAGSRTAFEWVRSYERAGYSAVALIPETHRCGNRRPRWCHRAEALMNQRSSKSMPTRNAPAEHRPLPKRWNCSAKKTDGGLRLACPNWLCRRAKPSIAVLPRPIHTICMPSDSAPRRQMPTSRSTRTALTSGSHWNASKWTRTVSMSFRFGF